MLTPAQQWLNVHLICLSNTYVLCVFRKFTVLFAKWCCMKSVLSVAKYASFYTYVSMSFVSIELYIINGDYS